MISGRRIGKYSALSASVIFDDRFQCEQFYWHCYLSFDKRIFNLIPRDKNPTVLCTEGTNENRAGRWNEKASGGNLLRF